MLTRSLTSGIGFLLRMSGMLSMMMRPPPGLQDTPRDVKGPGKFPFLQQTSPEAWAGHLISPGIKS